MKETSDMDSWKLVPHRSVGPLSLGMEALLLLEWFGDPDATFTRAGNENLVWDKRGTRVVLSEDATVAFIEVSSPHGKVVFEGVDIFSEDPAKVIDLLEVQLEANLSEKDTALEAESTSASTSIWREYTTTDEGRPHLWQCVTIEQLERASAESKDRVLDTMP